MNQTEKTIKDLQEVILHFRMIINQLKNHDKEDAQNYINQIFNYQCSIQIAINRLKSDDNLIKHLKTEITEANNTIQLLLADKVEPIIADFRNKIIDDIISELEEIK